MIVGISWFLTKLYWWFCYEFSSCYVTLSASISIVYIWWSFCISLCYSSSVWHWCFTVFASMHSYEYVILMHNVMHFFFSHVTKCGVGQIWTVIIRGSLGPICRSVITVGLQLGFGLDLGLWIVVYQPTAGESDKCRSVTWLKLTTGNLPRVCPTLHFIMSLSYYMF